MHQTQDEDVGMNQLQQPIFAVRPMSSVYDEIPALDNGTYMYPIAETTGNNVAPDLLATAQYEKIALPDVDNGTYIHPNAMPDTHKTGVKET